MDEIIGKWFRNKWRNKEINKNTWERLEKILRNNLDTS